MCMQIDKLTVAMCAHHAVFLQLVGSKANEIAESGAKKENYRISSDHVLQALEVYVAILYIFFRYVKWRATYSRH